MKYTFDGKTNRYGQVVDIKGTLNVNENGYCEGEMHVRGAKRENYKGLDYKLEGNISLNNVKSSGKEITTRLWPNGRLAPSVEVKIPSITEYASLRITARLIERVNKAHKIEMVNLSPNNKYAG